MSVSWCLCLTLSDASVIRLRGTAVKHFSDVMLVRAVDDVREAELTKNHSAGVAALSAATVQDDRMVFGDSSQFVRNQAGHEFCRRYVNGSVDMTRVILERFSCVDDDFFHTIHCIVDYSFVQCSTNAR